MKAFLIAIALAALCGTASAEVLIVSSRPRPQPSLIAPEVHRDVANYSESPNGCDCDSCECTPAKNCGCLSARLSTVKPIAKADSVDFSRETVQRNVPTHTQTALRTRQYRPAPAFKSYLPVTRGSCPGGDCGKASAPRRGLLRRR